METGKSNNQNLILLETAASGELYLSSVLGGLLNTSELNLLLVPQRTVDGMICWITTATLLAKVLPEDALAGIDQTAINDSDSCLVCPGSKVVSNNQLLIETTSIPAVEEEKLIPIVASLQRILAHDPDSLFATLASRFVLLGEEKLKSLLALSNIPFDLSNGVLPSETVLRCRSELALPPVVRVGEDTLNGGGFGAVFSTELASEFGEVL
jgi:CRISPR/Cas system CMR subunit Cmr4 (Cas7 group RAMP superfamily)